MSKATADFRAVIRRRDGHDAMLNSLRRAALIERRDPALAVAPAPPPTSQGSLALATAVSARPAPVPPGETVPGPLCVAAGVDPRRPLGAQGDSFWWGGPDFQHLGQPVEGHRPVIRGHDPAGGGYYADPFKVTLDGNGAILLGRFEADGTFAELAMAEIGVDPTPREPIRTIFED